MEKSALFDLEWRFPLQPAYSYFLFIVILLQKVLQSGGQRQGAYTIVSGPAADGGSCQVLQAEGKGPMERHSEQRFEKHTGAGVLVVLQQARDSGRVENARVVSVEAEIVVPLLDAGVQRAVVASEANGEEVILLGRVSQQEGAFWTAIQQRLSLVAVHHTPVAGQSRDLQQVRHKAVDVVYLGVHLPRPRLLPTQVTVPRSVPLFGPPSLQTQGGGILL